MNLFLFDGQLGAGKTLGMTLFALRYRFMCGCQLWSNYSMNIAKDFNSYTDFIHLADYNSNIVLLDEAHTSLDSRLFGSKQVIYFTQLIFYLRKLNTTMMLTSPNINTIDKRVRELANIYVFCSKNNYNFNYSIYDVQTGKHLKTYSIAQSKAIDIVKDVYDTKSIVSPLILPKNDDDFRNFTDLLKIKLAAA